MDTGGSAPEVDDSLYSRQRYVLGDSAMQRMASSRVLISGLGGVGVECGWLLSLATAVAARTPPCAPALSLPSPCLPPVPATTLICPTTID